MSQTPYLLHHFREYCRAALRQATSYRLFTLPMLSLANAGVLPSAVWKRLPVQGSFEVHLPDDRSFRYFSTPNDSNGRYLFWRGLRAFENEGLRTFCTLARRARLVLDIGANTGVFTLAALAANPDSTVISFEPVSTNFERLASAVRLNGWEARCQARRCAVSDFDGDTRFHVPFGDFPISASLDLNGFRGCRGSLVDVSVTKIDSACPEGTPVDLVKIDVEGFEDKVLRGMHRVLTESAPDLLIECNHDGPLTAVSEILSGLRYRFFHICDEKIVPVNKIIADERANPNRNYLFTVRGCHKELKSA